MVNNKATSVMGEILGKNTVLYHSSPFAFTRINRLNIPNTKGIPK